MPDRWQLLTEDPAERAAFASLAATLAWPQVPAAQPNRRRDVLRITALQRTWFLKRFRGTQWKNRLHFARTAPRARNDAEREAGVTQALRTAGFAAPRPIAVGRHGDTSYYLCAELPGRSLHDDAQHAADARRLHAAARHAGRVLAAGFWLPDLGADHVFVDAHGAFAVLDLHNGTQATAGPVPTRVLRRVLRRARRSCQDLPLGATLALRLAVRLLRAAGSRGRAVRALLRTQPPWSTAHRYDAPGKSRAYAERNPRRTARELELLARVWPGRPGESVLDLPCGAGRLLPWLRERGHHVLAADGSLAMLREAAAATPAPAPAVVGNALAMPFADHAVDGVVMFRFLHHLDRQATAAAIAEACRVARRFVVVSFFHPCSVHHVRRTWRQLGGHATTRHALPLGTLRRRFAAHDFALLTHAAELPYVRDLWLAAFARSTALAPAAAKA